MREAGSGEGAGRLWPLLLPGAYLLHLAEEVWGGPGFVAWASRHLSPGFTASRFLAINALAWPAMLAATLVAIRGPGQRWIVVSLATVLLLNGALHLGSTLAFGTYSPGTVSGVLVYLPLGAAALRRGAREAAPGSVGPAVWLGLALHALVAFAAFGVPGP